MFCSSRIKKLGITTAIIIIVIALIKVCYVCEEGFVSNEKEKDLVKQYAMRARNLPAKFVNGKPNRIHTTTNVHGYITLFNICGRCKTKI